MNEQRYKSLLLSILERLEALGYDDEELLDASDLDDDGGKKWHKFVFCAKKLTERSEFLFSMASRLQFE